MKEIDTSDWSVARVDLGGGLIATDYTLFSEEYVARFCKRYGYKLVSFKKGTNPLCAGDDCCEIDLPDSVPGMTVKAPELPKVEIPEDWDI